MRIVSLCSFPGCGYRATIKGLCASHDGQARRGVELRPVRRLGQSVQIGSNGPTCGFADCGRRVAARGLCDTHYRQMRRGDDLTPIRGTVSDIDAFWLRVRREDRLQGRVGPAAGDCWTWTERISTRGYGLFATNREPLLAHRWSYEHFVGPIPDGLALDHLCRNRACVNPDHLEPVTLRVNTLRGATVAAHYAARTHCARGHEFTPENTYRAPSKPSVRVCRECRRSRPKRSAA